MLDDLAQIAKLDKGNILSSIEHLPEQIRQAWEDVLLKKGYFLYLIWLFGQDQGNILSSIEHLPEQIRQAWDEIKNLEIPKEYANATNIIVSGMGGSALGARMIKHMHFKSMRVPFNTVNGYFLPNYVDKNSLVILSSYSGNTEETISCCYDAIKKRAM